MSTTPRGYRIPDPRDAIHPAVRDALMDIDADVDSLGSSTVYGARVWRSTNQTIGDDAWAAISFDTVRRNDGAVYAGGSPTRLTAIEDGWYAIVGGFQFAANSTGRRGAGIRLDGSTFISIQFENTPSGSYETRFDVATLYYLTSSQYVELTAYQNSGGDLDVTSSDDYSPHFEMVKVA